MSDIENILVHAWNKDAVNLAPAIDDIMTSKAAAIIDSMRVPVAMQMFGQSVPEVDSEVDSIEEPQNDYTNDDTSVTEIEEPTHEEE